MKQTLQGVYPTVAASLALLSELLHADPTPPFQMLLKQCNSSLAKVSGASFDTAALSIKDELDAIGVDFWNKASSFGRTINEVPHQDCSSLQGLLRLLAFKCIDAGSVTPFSQETQVSLLSLAAKTIQSLVACKLFVDTKSTEDNLTRLLEYGSSLAEDVLLVPPPNLTPAAKKAVLAFFCARIHYCISEENLIIVKWLRTKVRDILALGGLPSREMEGFARTISDAGLCILKGILPNLPEKESNEKANASIEWFMWALEILEKLDGVLAKSIQISTLKRLVKGYMSLSPPESGWRRAESSMINLLELEPSVTSWVEFIKLLITRDGGDGEILDAFNNALKTIADPEKDFNLLISLVQKLSDNHHGIRFPLFILLIKSLMGLQKSEDYSELLSKLLMISLFALTEKDHEQLKIILDLIPMKLAPDANISFIVITFIWKFGDRFIQSENYSDALNWFTLGKHQVLERIGQTTINKTSRKIILCLCELKEFEKAEKMILADCETEQKAKALFIAFYVLTLMKKEEQALTVLKKLTATPDLTVDILLWCTRSAQESGLPSLLKETLNCLLEYCKHTPVNNVDVVILIRCIVQLLVTNADEDPDKCAELGVILCSHFATALSILETLAEANESAEGLIKNITWFHKFGYTLALTYNQSWSPQTLTKFYEILAGILMLETRLCSYPDWETIGRLWMSRVARIVGLFCIWKEDEEVGQKQGNGKSTRSLLIQTKQLRQELNQLGQANILVEKQQIHQHIPRLTITLVSIELQLLTHLQDWNATAELFNLMDEKELPLEVVQSATLSALSSSSCSMQVVKVLLEKMDKAIAAEENFSLPAWLRTIVGLLLGRTAWDDALEYVDSAISLYKSSPNSYAEDEIFWLITTVWDQGLNFFYTDAAVTAQQWCLKAIEMAEMAKLGIASQLRQDMTMLCDRFIT